MPLAPLRPCLRCRKLIRKATYCDTCKPKDERGTYAARANVPRAEWDKIRKEFLLRNPFCVHCLRDTKRMERANVVDHIKPHRGDLNLFFDQSNLQALCYLHHDRKTATEDGGFGR